MDYLELTEALRYEASFAYLGSDGERLPKMMRDAADAIEELQQTVEHYKGCSDDWYKEACDYKAILPRWIPVTKRLPEEMDRSRGEWSTEIRPSDDVLVWLSHEERQSVAWYSHTYNEWTTVDENTVYCFGEVTYWKPLPEPPKEETE